MVVNFLTKEAKLFGDFWGTLENDQFLSKNYCGYFLGKIGLRFIQPSGHTDSFSEAKNK